MAIIGIIIAAVSVILAFFTVSVTGILLGGLFIVESFSVLVEAKSAFILIFWGRFAFYRCFFSCSTGYLLCSSFLWPPNRPLGTMDS